MAAGERLKLGRAHLHAKARFSERQSVSATLGPSQVPARTML